MGRPVNGETALTEVADCFRGAPAGAGLDAVVNCLVRVLDLAFAFVAEACEGANVIRVLAASGPHGRTVHHYPLAGTPCALVLDQGSATYDEGVRRLFPADESLGRLGVESFSGLVLRDADGSPIGLIAVMDTAPLSRTPHLDALLSILAHCAELELRRIRSERRISHVARQWTATVDTMPDLVAVIAPDYSLLRVNLALARFASCPPKDLVGKKCYQVLHGLEYPWPSCPHQQAMKSGKSISLEVEDPHIGRPFCVTCTPFYDDDGALVGTVHLARDISEQKQAARLREKLIAELQESLAKVKVLSGFLPICSVCKKIRNDKGYWEQVEVYVRDRTDANFSHGICPSCAKEVYPSLFR